MKGKKGKCKSTISGNNERTKLTPRCQPLRSCWWGWLGWGRIRSGACLIAFGSIFLEPLRPALPQPYCNPTSHSHLRVFGLAELLFLCPPSSLICSFPGAPTSMSLWKGKPEPCLFWSMGWTFELGLIFESVGQIAGIALPVLTPKKYFCTNGMCNGLVSWAFIGIAPRSAMLLSRHQDAEAEQVWEGQEMQWSHGPNVLREGWASLYFMSPLFLSHSVSLLLPFSVFRFFNGTGTLSCAKAR